MITICCAIAMLASMTLSFTGGQNLLVTIICEILMELAIVFAAIIERKRAMEIKVLEHNQDWLKDQIDKLGGRK